MKTNIVILLILFAGAFFMSPLISTPMLAEPTLQETACEPGFSRWPKCKCDRCRTDVGKINIVLNWNVGTDLVKKNKH